MAQDMERTMTTTIAFLAQHLEEESTGRLTFLPYDDDSPRQSSDDHTKRGMVVSQVCGLLFFFRHNYVLVHATTKNGSLFRAT
jgi:hypothetical protein